MEPIQRRQARRARFAPHHVLGGCLLAAYLGARVVAELTGLPLWARVPAAAAPAPLFVAWAAAFTRSVREEADELERRIQFEALAFAFACSFALLMGLGLLEPVVRLPSQDLSSRHVWAMLPIFYFGGLALARRRYA